MTPPLDWNRLRPGSDVRKSFEDLCCRLAELEPAPPESEFLRLAAPDGGAECLRRLPDGSEWGWQAKYFLTAPSAGQWAQIDKSARRALASHASLQRYVVCMPADRTKPGSAKWDRLVEKWTVIRPIKYEYWGRHELETMLTGGQNGGLLRYYFDKEFLSAEWAEQAASMAIANAGPRYTPDLNIRLPIAKSFEALCGTGEFLGRLDRAAESVRECLSDASARPALGAAIAADLARLDALASGIADMLASQDARKAGRIPAREIRERSGEAKAAISNITLELFKGRESHPEGDTQHRTSGVFDTEQDRLQRMYEALDELTDGELSEDVNIYNAKALLVAGEAGVGKTHLFCDIAKSRTAQKQTTVLLHGSHFFKDAPQETITRELDLDCSFAELLEGLDEAGRASGSRSLLMIDALNEGAGREVWGMYIRGLLHEIGGYSHVALAVSARTAYESAVVPGDIDPSALHRIEHRGFGRHTETALARFFDNNGIERPSVPALTPEFSNPQFLTVLCRSLKNKNLTRMPDGVNGLAAVYDLFIDSVNDKLSSAAELGISPRHRIVHMAVDAIAGRLAEGNHESLEYAEAHRLLARLVPGLPGLDRLLDAMISEGVLGAYATTPQRGERTERIRFAYERMSDYLIVKSLLGAAASADDAAKMLKGNGHLAAYVGDPLRYRGLVGALSAQLPERFRKELLEIAAGAPREVLDAAFIDSLLWRSPFSIGTAAVRLVDGLIKERRFPDRVLGALLAHSANPDSPLNADYLHRRLTGLEMGDRDSYLAVFLHEDYTHDPHSIVARHIDWAMKEGRNSDDKIARLAGTTLGWFLTASNRPVRDLSTKALVSMFASREGLLVDVMSKFRGCNDPYVAERLFCAAYGCAMRAGPGKGLKRLAAHAYDAVFRSGSPPPDIMLRDYARGTILLAGHCGIDLGIDPRACSPPHDSAWIDDFPTEDDIKGLEKAHGGHSRDGASSIFYSLGRMGDFYRYVIGESGRGYPWINARLPEDRTTWAEAFDAFGRSATPAQRALWAPLKSMLAERTRKDDIVDPQTGRRAPAGQACSALLDGIACKIGPLLRPEQAAAFDGMVLPCLRHSLDPSSSRYGFDTMQFARWIARRVFELGWTVERFDGHDAPLGSELLPQDGAERIGKKYQWIAYHELLARLSDNFEFFEPYEGGPDSAYESTSQLPSKRDIDPSVPHPVAGAGSTRRGTCGGGLPGAAYGGWGTIRDDDGWLKDASDLPDFGNILAVTDGGGAKWIALDVYYAADQRPARARAARLRPYRHVEVWAKSAIVTKKDGCALNGLARKKSLGSLRFPDPEDHYGPFLGELYWAHPFQKGREAAALPDAGIEIGGLGDHVEAHRTTYRYYAERGSRDFSLKGSISILAPSRFLAEGMDLVNMSDGTFCDAAGACVACDVPAGEAGAHALLFRQDTLARFLELNGYELFWHTAASKHIVMDIDRAGRGMPSRLVANSVYRMRGAGGPELVRSDANENRRPASVGPSDPGRPAKAARGRGRPPAERGERAGTAQPGGRRPAGEAGRMPKNGAGPGADRSPPVWLLGNDHPGADRSIDWRGGIPNMSDPDILIVDMTTLTEDTTYQIGRYTLGHIQKSIRDKFFYGGSTIVVIMGAMVWAPPPDAATRGPIFSFDGSLDPYAYSNYHVLPTVPEIVQAGRGRRILPDAGHDFKAYLDAVSHFNFYIEGHDLTIRMGHGGPRFYLEKVDGQSIMDNSGHYLGFTLVVTEAGGGMRTRSVENTGKLVFLPPYTEPAADAIGKILSACRKALPPCRPASGPAAGSASALGIQPGGHALPREMAPGPTVAENGSTADPPPPLPAGRAGRGGAAGPGATPPDAAGGPSASAGGGGTDAFLSYSHEAKDDVARPLVEGLERRGVTVWWDHDGIRMGDKLLQKIRNGLDGARHGVVVVSRGYLDSDWGKTELGAMLAKDLPTFPILYGVTAEEAEKRLPTLSGVLMRPWGSSPESVMDEIASAIKKGRANQGGPSAPAPGGPPQERGSLAAAVASIAAAVASQAAAEARPSAERFLAGRKILSAESGDFAQNAYFPYLYSPLPDGEKPVALFTLCPRDLGSGADVATREFEEWVRSTETIRVDGRQVRVLGSETGVDIGVLLAIEPHPRAPADAALAYREFESRGFFEFGTSHLFFGRNESGEMELDLCYMVGEFWSFLAQARLFHQRTGLDLPSTAYMSVRNSGSLYLGNYGDEAPRHGPAPGPSIPPTHHRNISLRCDFKSVRGAIDEEIAWATMEVAKKVCNAYGETTPRCYNEDGSFSWELWHAVAQSAARGDRT